LSRNHAFAKIHNYFQPVLSPRNQCDQNPDLQQPPLALVQLLHIPGQPLKVGIIPDDTSRQFQILFCFPRTSQTSKVDRRDRLEHLYGRVGRGDHRPHVGRFPWVRLRGRDVDREARVIRLRPELSKNADGRVLALEGVLWDLIERRWLSRALGCPLVFHASGRPIGDWRKAWARACIAAGLFTVDPEGNLRGRAPDGTGINGIPAPTEGDAKALISRRFVPIASDRRRPGQYS
jgi:hypothetical protein